MQILNIHTARMRTHQLLSSDVDVVELAVETKNFSGAELEGLVRAAQSTAMNRHIKVRAFPNLFHLFGWHQQRHQSCPSVVALPLLFFSVWHSALDRNEFDCVPSRVLI